MKTNLYKSFFLALACVCGASLFVLADGAKAPGAGGKVEDPVVSVPANAYVTFSTVYNGKRYYLGVDTVAAKAVPPKDTVAFYESPNHATMWIAGPLWSHTGKVLDDKDYTRTIQSAWLRDRFSRDRFLALGAGSGTYNTLRLLADGTMWHTAKDSREQDRYINGFLYYYSDATGVDVYRYLRYDPIYGFSRLYEAQPENSQRISVWDRKTGKDLVFSVSPSTITFDLTKMSENITAQLAYYDNVDRFRSRFDRTDIYVSHSAAVTSPDVLMAAPYNMTFHYSWKSNPIDHDHMDTYDGNSMMPCYTITSYDDDADPENPQPVWGWSTFPVVHVANNTMTHDETTWRDIVTAVGTAPIDNPSRRLLRKPADSSAPVEGTYVNQNDWLYIHFYINGEAQEYKDSIYVVRQAFHNEKYAKIELNAVDPSDENILVEGHVFPYTYNNRKADGTTPVQNSDVEFSFNVAGRYESGNIVRNSINIIVQSSVGESGSLNIAGARCYRDTLWTDDAKTSYDDIVLYDTVLVSVLNPDGTPCDWIESVTLPARNQVKVRVEQFETEEIASRTAQIQYTYRYRHSSAVGDWAVQTRTMWITQEGKGAHDSELYSFNHKGELDSKGLQAVHEKHNTLYAVPGEPLNLPVHRDLWGYYRWFSYDDATMDRAVTYNNKWSFTAEGVPTNKQGTAFMPINYPNTAASRGRWDIYDDVNNPTNDLFTTKHFEQWRQTPVPAIYYPKSDTQTGKIACDVSEYYDVAATGEIGKSLSAMTEPTLSYRQIFDIQPAKTRAEEMKDKLVKNGDGVKDANWLEKHTIVAPAGRAFKIQPQNPIATAGSEDIDEEHLQYIYYFRPDAVGTTDNNMGEDPGSNYDKTATYARIGKKYKAGATLRKAKLLTLEDINNLDEPIKVFVINPRQNGGYILGGNASGEKVYKSDILSGRTDTADLRRHIEDDILNSGSTYSNYIVTLTKTSENHIKLKSDAYNSNLCAHVSSFGLRKGIDWYNATWWGEAAEEITLSTYSSTSSDRITNINDVLVKMYIHAHYDGITNASDGDYQGYMTAYNGEWVYRYSNWQYKYNNANIHLENLGDDDAGGSGTINQGWCFYEIIDPTVPDHFETPRWEKFNGSDWDEVARWDYETNAAVCEDHYNMTADGALHMDDEVLPDTGTNFSYRLRTEHFQLAKFSGRTRSADKEMLKLGTIISEDDIERDYNIIYSLDMENWPAPKTSDVVAYNYHFPWDFTELGYHYPVGDGEGEIPADKRIFNASIPGKGEYCFINKFVAPTGPNTQNAGKVFECMDGAENGYMLCVNAAQKRTTIMNFEYDQLSCSGQQIYLVANYCNPVQNNYDPQITADLEGWDGSQWVPIYRYKSGKIAYHAPSEQHWYQMALPIDREHIKDYRKFRCRAEIDGAPNRNCHLLIDRLRFIEKARGFTVFQNKATCIKDDSVTVLIRLNYNADPDLYQPGKLVAYQLQMWKDTANNNAGGYVPMTYSKVKPGYVKDGFTVVEGQQLKTSQGNDFGYVYVPEEGYNPQESETTPSEKRVALVTQAADSLVKWGLLSSGDKATRITNFSKETGNVKTFEQVMSAGSLFGGTTPHIKSYVQDGDKWIVYIMCRLKVADTDNNSFRVGMTLMNGLNDKPTFTEEACATFHTFQVKQRTSLRLDGAEWTNHPRTWYDEPGRELLPANETYRASVALQLDPTIFGSSTANPRCKFDLLHATESVRANDAAFEAKYGCTRTQFKDDMEAFRTDDKDNPNRELTDWTQVTWQNFTGTGRNEVTAKAIYNRLNHLVTSGLLEIGLDYRDIYMGDRADSYFYLSPIPASGRYELRLGNHNGTADTTMHASVCNDTLWLELHSEEPTAKLRFGYDSRVGDTYIVPTIRASRSEANGLDSKHLNVRVAEISTTSDAYNVVIGWEKTELIGSNDPDWSDVKQFKYTQDIDMRNHKPSETEYYTKGDVIEFTPAAGNNITLKAGYWYQFKAPFYAVSKLDEYTADPATPTGHSQFILAIAPDTVHWTPAHPDAANFWNDDANWTAIVNNTPKADVIAKVPMSDTRVIIPQVAEGLLPIVADYVVEDKDTLHYGYVKNTCKEILFKKNAQILGQEKLDYKKAFVDLRLLSGNWQTFSPALKHVYSGDMYIPRNPATADASDFAPGTFSQGEGSSFTSNPRVWPYAFYQGFYNSSVPVAFYNSDEDGLPVATTTAQSKNSVDWVRSNVLDMPYHPGTACVLNGYGPSDADGEELIIRLPKQETEYYGYGKDPNTGKYIAGTAVPMQENGTPRPAFAALEHNLAYDKTALGSAEGLSYTLHNAIASDIFFFGNPTMSLIDVYTLCTDNASVLKHEEGTYHFTAYQLIDGSNYTVRPITGPGQFFIAPQRAVGLIAASAGNDLTITLKPGALVAVDGEGTLVSDKTIKGGAPVRRMPKADKPADRYYLYIAAANEAQDKWGGETLAKAYMTLGKSETAHRGFVEGEDAPNIASGLNYYSDYSFSTPLSIYSITDNQAMMYDMRDSINMIPLAFTTLDEKYTFSQYTLLSFAMEGDWKEPLYLFDAVTGDSIRIVNGLQLSVVTPQSDQLRYYINGAANTSSSDDHSGTPTGIEIVNEPNDQVPNDQMVHIYDVLGRHVMTLAPNDLIYNVKLPTGVYIISRGNKTERMVIK